MGEIADDMRDGRLGMSFTIKTLLKDEGLNPNLDVEYHRKNIGAIVISVWRKRREIASNPGSPMPVDPPKTCEKATATLKIFSVFLYPDNFKHIALHLVRYYARKHNIPFKKKRDRIITMKNGKVVKVEI